MTPEELTFNKLQEPAPLINYMGTKFWYNKEGFFHRDNDLPAIILANGTRYWFKNNKLHRKHAPAIIKYGGSKYYFKNGIKYKPIIEHLKDGMRICKIIIRKIINSNTS